MRQIFIFAIFSLIAMGLRAADFPHYDLLLGSYKGNVSSNVIGKHVKTGHLSIKNGLGAFIEIRCWSALTPKIIRVFLATDILDAMGQAKSKTLSNKILEKRVRFKKCDQDNRGYIETCESGVTALVTECKLKIHNDALYACRIQVYTEGEKRENLYTLELNKLVKNAESDVEKEHDDDKCSHRKKGWDF